MTGVYPVSVKLLTTVESSGGNKLTFGTGTRLTVRPSKSKRKVRSLCLFLSCVLA